MSKNKHMDNPTMVWIDCEMTGLDLHSDALIEVAVIVTDYDLQPLGPGLDVLITPPPGALESMNDFVRTMHTSSGLLDDIAAEGIPMEEAQRLVLEHIQRFVPEPGTAVLAGNSVGTDKMFLLRDMPEVISYLHYRIIDVSTLKELVKRWAPPVYFGTPAKHGGHRALADIAESIDELRYYRAMLFKDSSRPSRSSCARVSKLIAATPTLKALPDATDAEAAVIEPSTAEPPAAATPEA